MLDKAQKEISKLQSSSAFARVVRDILETMHRGLRMSSDALELLQGSAEWFCTDTLAATDKVAVHAQPVINSKPYTFKPGNDHAGRSHHALLDS